MYYRDLPLATSQFFTSKMIEWIISMLPSVSDVGTLPSLLECLTSATVIFFSEVDAVSGMKEANIRELALTLVCGHDPAESVQRLFKPGGMLFSEL